MPSSLQAANGVCCYVPGGKDELAVPSCADGDCPPEAIVFYEASNAICSKSWKAKVDEGYGYIAGSPDANAPEYECVFIVTGTVRDYLCTLSDHTLLSVSNPVITRLLQNLCLVVFSVALCSHQPVWNLAAGNVVYKVTDASYPMTGLVRTHVHVPDRDCCALL